MAESLQGRAAVLVLISGESDNERVLMAKRSDFMRHHPGESGFPGGKWELGDASLMETAIREACEEVTLEPEQIHVLTHLNCGFTGRGMRVTPFVARVSEADYVQPRSVEFSECFWVSRREVMEDCRLRTDLFQINGRELWSPVYRFSGHEVWGFSARVLVEFANRFWGCSITRCHKSAPTFRYK